MSIQSFNESTFFFRFPDSIAWATFDRAWSLFEEDSVKLFKLLRQNNKQKDFNGGLSYPYFSKMLQAQMNCSVNSWAIRWTAIAVLNNMLSVFPSVSLSKHIGFSSDATHEKNSKDYNKELKVAEKAIPIKKQKVDEDEIALKQWRQFYLDNFIPKRSLIQNVKESAKKIIPETVLKGYRKIRK